jgi:RimJ/RimL family protein N-acetyltransferase/acyl carrier protein
LSKLELLSPDSLIDNQSIAAGLAPPASLIVLPAMETTRVVLRELIPNDYPLLYRMAMDAKTSFRWRYRSRQLSFEEFIPSLREGVLCQFAVLSKATSDVIGLVVCYNAHFRNGNAYLAIISRTDFLGTGLVMEGCELLVDYLFDCYGFSKLYAECPEFSLSTYRSGIGKFFEEEGRLLNHEYFMDRSWDLYILALHKSAWKSERSKRELRRTDLAMGLSEFKLTGAPGPDFSSIVKLFIAEWGLSQDEEYSEHTRLVEDLGLDSIAFLQAVVLLEDLGVFVDESVVRDLKTLGDIHFAILQRETST